jgi:hypothetical protein
MRATANAEIIEGIKAEGPGTKIEDKSSMNNEEVNYMASNKSLARITDENGSQNIHKSQKSIDGKEITVQQHN